MQIGPYKLANKYILAPMAGVTDRPFRQLCREQGAGLAVSEMVGSISLLRGSAKTLRRANHDGENAPISVQIVGADPELMGEAAKINEDLGAQIIDINMGCPAKKVCNMASGSALLRDEKKVADILESVVNAVAIPVTLKIRTGWDKDNRNAISIAKIAESAGIQALAIHGRTRSCFFKGEAEYETIRAVKNAINIPVIANGDIDSAEKAALVLEKTGADSVMIGRAAQGKPWIFKQLNHYDKTKEILAEPSAEEVKHILLGHLDNLYDFYGEYSGVRMARKHVSWYTKGQHSGAKFRHEFNRIETCLEQIYAINLFFDEVNFKEREANDVSNDRK
ncbi:MAG: tRNA dihydrouridine synthase DusB [Francisellaceae bacterium]|nr:tRNA dihydrouridine synthase DusB [Francisellaceae bacterium]MBT6207282.1 tRNA dihydrouridine synthase DusB [Francisellaceae bacterium]MBT6538140.1 tRNA dihydrouridine synthase DusB [Francisellaceae bacterium]